MNIYQQHTRILLLLFYPFLLLFFVALFTCGYCHKNVIIFFMHTAANTHICTCMRIAIFCFVLLLFVMQLYTRIYGFCIVRLHTRTHTSIIFVCLKGKYKNVIEIALNSHKIQQIKSKNMGERAVWTQNIRWTHKIHWILSEKLYRTNKDIILLYSWAIVVAILNAWISTFKCNDEKNVILCENWLLIGVDENMQCNTWIHYFDRFIL